MEASVCPTFRAVSLPDARLVALIGAGLVPLAGRAARRSRLKRLRAVAAHVRAPFSLVLFLGLLLAVRRDDASPGGQAEPESQSDDVPSNTPPAFTAQVARSGGAVITPMGDYEVRVEDDELAALILPPRGHRPYLRILTGEGSWSVRPVGGRWSFAARREEDREPVSVFQRRPLRASGRLIVSGGTELDLQRRTRRRDWTLRDGDRELLILSAPRDRHREQIMRFELLGECPDPALLVPFAMWIAIEIDRQDRRLWRHSRRDDPDRFPDGWFTGGWFGNGGGGGDGGGGDGGGGCGGDGGGGGGDDGGGGGGGG